MASDNGFRQSILRGLASGEDPLSDAFEVQTRVREIGFDWEDHRGPLAKVAEELEEVRRAFESAGRDQNALEEELGDLLFAAVNLTRLAGIHPVRALRGANRKFSRRFAALEAIADRRNIDIAEASLESLDQLWEEVKRGES